ncbi:helix-turn-helix domain-containing protein [Candidatus Avelusimicrobium caledoniensis]|uniref:helix-turn-helix domain-containing protein n=1 Tax=Candidatus Avelusimicrobium caledoniensis TaxID=3416220 RepID=UPI003D0F5877
MKSTNTHTKPSKAQKKPVQGQSGAFMTVYEIADLLRVEPLTIYRYIRSKKLTAYKLGKDYRVQQKDFERFLKNCKTVK